jgi:hypothetical protein
LKKKSSFITTLIGGKGKTQVKTEERKKSTRPVSAVECAKEMMQVLGYSSVSHFEERVIVTVTKATHQGKKSFFMPRNLAGAAILLILQATDFEDSVKQAYTKLLELSDKDLKSSTLKQAYEDMFSVRDRVLPPLVRIQQTTPIRF